MTNLGDLEIFSRVISMGSMSAAGRALGLSPAVGSGRGKGGGGGLGTRLFQRTTRQISLTEAGQGFYDRIVGILSGIEEAEAFVSGRSGAVRGTLRISAPTSFGRLHIAPHLKGFMDLYPDLVINLVLTDDFSDIVGGGFDLAIRIGELSDSSLVARRLAPVRRVLCASPDYIARRGMPPTWDVGPALKRGELVQVLPDYEGSRNVVLSAVYPSRQFLPVKVRLFIDYLAELYGSLPYWER